MVLLRRFFGVSGSGGGGDAEGLTLRCLATCTTRLETGLHRIVAWCGHTRCVLVKSRQKLRR